MTKEDIKYIEDYLEWVRQNMNPAEVDFEHFANGMMNCNNILSQALSLHNVVGQSEQCCEPLPKDSFYLGTTCPKCKKPFRNL